MTVDEAKLMLGMRFDAQLADFLKVRGPTVWGYRARGTLPVARIFQVEAEAAARRAPVEAKAS